MVEQALALIGALVIGRKAIDWYRLYFESRDGNSGRMRHWLDDWPPLNRTTIRPRKSEE
jgi:hypothetical protein